MTTHDPLQDGISSVQLMNSMGDDLTVVNVARVSMAKQSEWKWRIDDLDQGFEGLAQEKYLSEKDCGLIKYLANHDHWTPFAHCMVTLRIKMPIFIARQWFKHEVGFVRNETSRRYVDDPPQMYIPKMWRKRAANVKQGSSDETVELSDDGYHVPDSAAPAFVSPGLLVRLAVATYNGMIKMGIAPEMARMVLPQNMYTEFWETGPLAGYARIAKLRLDAHAQKEVQHYASAVDQIMRDLFPVSWGALMGYEE